MTPCPNCQHPVEILDKHFGTLFTCPRCSAVFFVDWNGQPEMATHEEESEPDGGFSSGFESDIQGGSDFQSGNEFQQGDFQGEISSSGDAFSVPSSHSQMSYEGTIPESVPDEFSPQEEPYLEAADEIPPGSEFVSPESYGEPYQPAEPEQPVEYEETPEAVANEDFGNSNEDSSADESTPADPYASPEVESENYDFSAPIGEVQESISDTSDFSDVAEFANSDTAVGPLSYTLTIEGLESSQLVKEIREAMSDSKFGWDVDELLATIKNGKLEISDLSPTKTFVFVSRIKYLPLKVSWRQNVL